MNQTERLAALRLTLASMALFVPTTSWGWFWDKTNTVKAYEDCLKKNISSIVDISVIKDRCIQKLAAHIPVDRVHFTYSESDHSDRSIGNPIKGESLKHYNLHFSTSNSLLTEVTAVVSIKGEPERTVGVSSIDPKRSILVEALPNSYKTDFERSNSYKLCASIDYGCIHVRVISAKGFDITIN